MSRVGILAVVVSLFWGVGAEALTLHGEKVAETFSLEGQALTLNGAGVKKSFLFAVYVAALYLDSRTGDASVAAGGDRPKVLALRFVRDRDSGDIDELFREGFFNNAQEQLPQLEGRIDQLLTLFPGGVEEGQTVTFAYRPSGGTRVTLGDRETVIEGADFMAALWSLWLGDVPADHGLKRALLGQP